MAANTLVNYYQCSSCDSWEFHVQGTTGLHCVTFGRMPMGHKVQHDYSCTCKGFKFRKTCKHIEEAKKHHCCWMQQLDGGEPKFGKCPECSKPVRSVPHRI